MVADSWLSRSLALALAALIAGCASSPPQDDPDAVAAYEEANDPLEPLNRYIFEVNLALDKLLLRPVATIYRGAVPAPARDGVRNVLHNLDTPITFIHDLLQGEPERAGESFGRFTGNTLIGVGGLFDVMAADDAKSVDAGIPYHKEDLGQTLAVWGASEGPYLMLPVLGASNVRDTIGKVGDSFLEPTQYLLDSKNRLGYSLTQAGLNGLDFRSRNIETLDDIERTSIDFYATLRSLYRQNRAAQIANGRRAATPLPDLSGEFNDDKDPERVSTLSD